MELEDLTANQRYRITWEMDGGTSATYEGLITKVTHYDDESEIIFGGDSGTDTTIYFRPEDDLEIERL